MIQFKDVYKAYASPETTEPMPVLAGIDLTIEAGASVAVVGPSGCGKSTLLNLIGALDQPTQGQVSLEGQDLSRLDDRDLSELRNQKVGFIFQMHHLLPQLTVLENVLVPTLAQKTVHKAQHTSLARSLLKQVGLEDVASHLPSQLSGGQRQRVAVARALINQPKVLLADEPTGALDQATAEQISDLLVDMHEAQGVTLVMVTHAKALAARMDKLYTLDKGRLVPSSENQQPTTNNQ
ncbi:MAG: ABC transporter ATP-binding protein [Planctomycetes bacterium]|nr:ABC transporter ATP-binding protein [Planctomycetota bacterium]